MKGSAFGLMVLASIVGLFWWRTTPERLVTRVDDGVAAAPGTGSLRPARRFKTLADSQPVGFADQAVEPIGAPEEESEENEGEIVLRIEGHRRQGPPEPDVVTAVVPAINGVIEAVTRETQGTVEGVDCRSDGCLVDLAWKDRENALAQKDAILAAGARLNCQPSFAVRGKKGTDDGRAVLFLEYCRAPAPR